MLKARNVPALFANLGPIGADVASPASFTDLTANTIAGAVVATAEELVNATDNQKVVTPYALDQYLHAPNAIGRGRRTHAFTQLTAQTFQGDAVATVQDITDASANTLAVLPPDSASWGSPNALGTTAPNAAYLPCSRRPSLAGDAGHRTTSPWAPSTTRSAPNTLVEGTSTRRPSSETSRPTREPSRTWWRQIRL